MRTKSICLISLFISLLVSNSQANLIANGDFENGTSGITTNYTNKTSPTEVQQYCLTTNPHSSYPDSGVASYGDHTSGSGKMMMVNGSDISNKTVWQQTVSVKNYTDYVFSYYLSSWSAHNPAKLKVYINGISIGTDADASTTTGYWEPISYNWNSGSNNTATIRLVDIDVHVGGNDFAIDDISLEPSAEDNAGNTMDTARDIGTLNDEQEFTDWVGNTDTDDYYKFTLSSDSAKWAFSLVLSGMTADADVQLFNSSRGAIWRGNNGDTSNESCNMTLNADTYYVRVYPYADGTNYKLTLSATRNNDSPTLNLTGPSSNITVCQGQTITITWTDSDPDNNATITVYRDTDTGSTPWSNEENHSGITFIMEDIDGSGDQHVWDTNGVPFGTYSIWGMISDGVNDPVYSRAPGLVTIQDDNTKETARDIGTLNGSVEFTGWVGDTDTYDFYKFKLSSDSSQWLFSLLLTGMTANAQVRLLDVNGVKIWRGDTGVGAGDESTTLTLPSGTYYVRVYPNDSKTNDTNYILKLSASGYIGQEIVSIPTSMSGITTGYRNKQCTFNFSGASSNLGHPVEYQVNWGDGDTSDWDSDGTLSHTWDTAGYYTIQARARCAEHTDVMSAWATMRGTIHIQYVAETVSEPTSMSGPTTGEPGTQYTFTFSGASSDLGHSVAYQVDWGDGKTSSWDSVGTFSHSWNADGIYIIKAYAKCIDHPYIMSSSVTMDTIHIETETEDEPPQEIELTRFEINQCFQTVKKGINDVCDVQEYKLIETKPFVVRVTLENKSQSKVNLEVVLSIKNSVSNKYISFPAIETLTIQSNSEETVDFICEYSRFSRYMIAGNYNFNIKASLKGGNSLFEFNHTEYFYNSPLGKCKIYVVPISTPGIGTGEWEEKYLNLTEKLFPIPNRRSIASDKFEVELCKIPVISSSLLGTLGPVDVAVILPRLDQIRKTYCPSANIVVGITHEDALVYADGSTDLNSTHVIVRDTDEIQTSLVHELGHCIGGLGEEYVISNQKERGLGGTWDLNSGYLFEINPPPLKFILSGKFLITYPNRYFLSVCDESDENDHPDFFLQESYQNEYPNPPVYEQWQCDGKYVGIGGYDVEEGKEIPVDYIGMMGTKINANTEFWISGIEYTGLKAKKKSNSSSIQNIMSELITKQTFAETFSIKKNQVLLSGIINLIDRTSELNPIIPLPNIESTPESIQSEYQLVFKSQDSIVLNTFNFDCLVSEFASNEHVAFNVITDVPEETEVIQVTINGVVVGEWKLTDNAPVLEILSPTGGEEYLDNLSITWSGTDADGDELSYTVEYSHDSGNEWHPLTINTIDNELIVNAHNLPGGINCLVKVIASDGWNQSEAVSEPFIIPTKGPEIEILDPNDGTTVLLSEDFIEGRCFAWDRETGYIEDANNIVWSSNLDGFLGLGGSVGLRIGPGEHIISVIATDPDGESITECVDVNAIYDVTPSYMEDFETKDFNNFEWQLSGDSEWNISSIEKRAGSFSAQAGSIGHEKTSSISVTLTCRAGNIRFYRKVSSEDYDYLNFYIDGKLEGSWSGEEDWEQVIFPVTAGTRTFKWEYTKDPSSSGGEDTAWIDDIVFPMK
jgi:hypothetical protein